MPEHTPGPWHVARDRIIGSPSVRSTNRLIARVLYHGGSEDREVHVNAALIAAAPELLEACKLALWSFAAEDNMVIAALRSAIDKAEAGQQELIEGGDHESAH